MRIWYALDVQCERRACEAVEYALMEAGANGTESNEQLGTSNSFIPLTSPTEFNYSQDQLLRVSGYFQDIPNRDLVRRELADALRIYDLGSSSVLGLSLREVVEQDWLGEWKKSWQPIEIGDRFIIAPPWATVRNEGDRVVIRVEPGMAFGTGTHETTRLCLRAIEKYFRGGSFLDVGTGTGILAMAAAKLFPDAHIVANDTDPDAVRIARKNADLNGVAGNIDFQVGTISDQTASADLVCANLTVDVIMPLLPALISVTCGRLIVSGILESQLEILNAHLFECGANALEIMHDGEWVAVIL
jgi:ribosomal protein L11 methyltransferase